VLVVIDADDRKQHVMPHADAVLGGEQVPGDGAEEVDDLRFVL
jgi:hypothetical protein